MLKIVTFTIFIKSLISVASRVDFSFFKALTAPSVLFTLDTDNELSSRLKSSFISFLIKLSSTTGCNTFFSHDITTSFSISFKNTADDLSVSHDSIAFKMVSRKCSTTYAVLNLINFFIQINL